MKKKIAILAGILSCLFLFAACSAQIEISLNPNWTANGSVTAPTELHEKLTYAVSFESTDLATIRLDVAEGSSYTTELSVDPSYEAYGERVAVYKYTTTLILRGKYFDIKNNRDLVSFGTTGNDETDKPDSIVIEVWFYSMDGGKNLRPIRSKMQGLFYGLSTNSSAVLSRTNYTAETEYSKNGATATVKMTNNWTDEELSKDHIAINEYADRSIYPKNQTFKAEKLTKNYSVFDSSQLYFIGRGVTFAENSSNTVMLVSPYGKTQCSFTCTAIADTSVNFTYADNTVSSVSTAKVTFSNSGNGSNRGPSRTALYARKTDTSSGYFNVPVRITEAFAYDMGSIQFDLRTIER